MNWGGVFQFPCIVLDVKKDIVFHLRTFPVSFSGGPSVQGGDSHVLQTLGFPLCSEVVSVDVLSTTWGGHVENVIQYGPII
jgi:hypothetical protein